MRVFTILFVALLELAPPAIFSQNSSWKQHVRDIQTRQRGFTPNSAVTTGSTGWQWLNPLPQGNTLRSVKCLDENTIIASGGAIVKSTNAGQTWIVRSRPVADVEGLTFMSFANANIGQAISISPSQDRIYRTTDGGANWIRQWSNDTVDLSGISFPSPDTGYAAGTTHYDPLTSTSHPFFIKTTDGGTTWQEKTMPVDVRLSGVSFADPMHGLVATLDDIMLRTTDGGEHWSYQDSLLFNPIIFVSMFDKNQAIGYGSGGSLIRTTDGGLSWESQLTYNSAFFLLYGAQLIDSAHCVAVGTDGTILRSTDGGMNWNTIQSVTSRTLNAVSFSSIDSGVAVGAGGIILRTTDGGASWVRQSRGTTNPIYSLDFSDARHGVAAGASVFFGLTGQFYTPGRIYRTTNGGTEWLTLADSGRLALNRVVFLDSAIVIAIGDSGEILRSTDGGANWTYETHLTDVNLRAISMSGGSTGVVVGGNDAVVNDGLGQIILRTTDAGITWSELSSGTTQGLTGVSFLDSLNGYAVGNFGLILHTTDGGTTWSVQQSADQPYILFDVNFTDVNNGVAVGDNGNYFSAAVILHTSDGGTTWTSVYSGPSPGLFRVSFTDAARGYAVGMNPLWYGYDSPTTLLQTVDGGASWFSSNNPTSNALYDIHVVKSSLSRTLFAAGDVGTIMCSALSPLSSKLWVGTIDSSWNIDGNWSPFGTPTPGDSVIIPSSVRQPVVYQTQQQITVASLTILSGARLSISNALPRLVVKGDVTIDGSLEIFPGAATDIIVGGNWKVQPGGGLQHKQLLSDDGFVPALSTVYLTGSGTVEQNFYNVIFDTSSSMTSGGNISVSNHCTLLKNMKLRSQDTLLIQSAKPEALAGTGNVIGGSIRRPFAPGSTQVYRFESAGTTVFFDTVGTQPLSLTMTIYDDTAVTILPDEWTIVPSRVDTLNNIITADSVGEFSKWAIGIPRPGGGMRARDGYSPQDTVLAVRRFFELEPEGGIGFIAHLGLHYEPFELPAGISEDSLQLWRRPSLPLSVHSPQDNIPKKFSLSQNFPNPFNPVTAIRFALPQASIVSLKVYNMLGQKVRTLLNDESMQAGEQEVKFDAAYLASGIYYYRITANSKSTLISFTEVKKMVVVK